MCPLILELESYNLISPAFGDTAPQSDAVRLRKLWSCKPSRVMNGHVPRPPHPHPLEPISKSTLPSRFLSAPHRTSHPNAAAEHVATYLIIEAPSKLMGSEKHIKALCRWIMGCHLRNMTANDTSAGSGECPLVLLPHSEMPDRVYSRFHTMTMEM